MRVVVVVLIAALVGFAVWPWSDQTQPSSDVSRPDDLKPAVTDEHCEGLWRSEIRGCGDLPEGPRKARCFDGANLRRTHCQAPALPKPNQRDPDEQLIREMVRTRP